ncbi:hypothetical protein GCM10023328_47590 [Modestobacter marinus]
MDTASGTVRPTRAGTVTGVAIVAIFAFARPRPTRINLSRSLGQGVSGVAW